MLRDSFPRRKNSGRACSWLECRDALDGILNMHGDTGFRRRWYNKNYMNGTCNSAENAHSEIRYDKDPGLPCEFDVLEHCYG